MKELTANGSAIKILEDIRGNSGMSSRRYKEVTSFFPKQLGKGLGNKVA